MSDIDVIVPVLNRPANAAPLVESLAASTDRARLYFVCSRADREQEKACHAAGGFVLLAMFPPGPGDYARKINTGFRQTRSPLVLLAADDLRFHPGWLEAVEACAAERPDAGVIGTNDLANPQVMRGRHSTHPVVRRSYVKEIGGVVGRPGIVYCEEYDHQFVDNELYATAVARGAYVHCYEARVEHMHPIFRRAVKMDATSEKGLARGAEDRRLFESRRHLWEREAVEA